MSKVLYSALLVCIFGSYDQNTLPSNAPVVPIAPPPVTIHNNHTIRLETTTSTDITTQINQYSKIISIVKHKINQLPFQKWNNAVDGYWSYIMEHKLVSCGVGLLALHLACSYQLIRGNSHFKNESLWSAWKKEISLRKLVLIPKDELARELIITIQRRYFNPKSPSDFFGPLVAFLVDLQAEIQLSKLYIKRYNWLDKLLFTRIFLGEITAFRQGPEKIQRLFFIKELFLTWTAEHKLELNTNYYKGKGDSKNNFYHCIAQLNKKPTSNLEQLKNIQRYCTNWKLPNLWEWLQQVDCYPPPESMPLNPEIKYFTSLSPNRKPTPANIFAFRLLTKSSAPNTK